MFEDMQNVINPRLVLSIVAFVAVALVFRTILLGGGHLVHLGSAPPLAGQISQALGPDPNGSLRQDGSDYTLRPKYFDKEGWAVVDILSKNKSFQGGFAVMKKTDGIYQVAYGPGTSIAFTQLSSMPFDVAVYIQAHEAVYNPVPGQ